MLDLGKLFDQRNCDTWLKTQMACTARRIPADVPEAFTKVLDTKVFTNNSDVKMVGEKYTKTFMEVMRHAASLDYQGIRWTLTEVVTIVGVLPYCTHLTKLVLTENQVGTADDDGNTTGDEPLACRALADNLPKCTALRQVLMRGCWLHNQDLVALAPALPKCTSLVQLNLQDNFYTAEGCIAVAKVLPNCRLGLIYMASNKIGDAGARALADNAPQCDTLRELWLTDCDIPTEAAEYLRDKWDGAGKAEGFLHYTQ
jgi:Ran GTPase-activating protein (RanGAP) involved in mRNA processing and transport